MTNAEMNPNPTPAAPSTSSTPAQESQGSQPASDAQSIFGVSKPETTSTPTPVAAPVQAPAAPATPAAPVVQQPVAPQAQPQQQSAIDPKALAQSIVQAQYEAQRQNAQAAQSQGLTEEQFNAKYGIRKITAQDVQAIFDQDPNKAAVALENIMNAKVRQAVLMAQGVLEPKLGEFAQQLSPVQAMMQKQHEEAIWTNFVTRYPDLKDERALVYETVNAHLARGTKFSSPEEAMKTVAEFVQGQITRLRGTGQAQPSATTQAAQPRPATRTMTPTLTGGRSASGPKTPPSDAQSIFAGTSNPGLRKK
jgi:hypothetical protein